MSNLVPVVIDDALLRQLALSTNEYQLACKRLGRNPSALELGMISALWSEHCGYKHSKPLFRHFPTEGDRVLTDLGSENAGAVDIGDGWVIVMKIESHNHPSAIEPYEGAATGVGGIVRDIIAMGARPIALLNSLRFGPLTERNNRRLLTGVVSGVGGYGNCLGVPNVGGETVFGVGYSGNPLVNAMCVGLARKDGLVSASGDGVGNVYMLVGAETGRDGLHGATFASVELDESSEERRPAVQVGNPFMEKLLMESCIELTNEHRDWIVGLQDLGAAGLTGGAVECAARAGTGVYLDVSRVPRREANMTPYDVMLSESQERMLVIVKREHIDDVSALFMRWELKSVVIGEVTNDGLARITDNGEEVAAIDVGLLTTPPTYEPEAIPDPKSVKLNAFNPTSLPDLTDGNSTLLELLSVPNIADKSWIFRQYDQQVMGNTVVVPGSDAGIIRIKGTNRAIALSTDGDGRAVALDPWAGASRTIFEAARNVSCSGARPIAITDCLNFGDPDRPEIYYQLSESVKGIAEACKALRIPVVSGNVSLYNESAGIPVDPTPVIGMLGLIQDVEKIIPMPFSTVDSVVVLLGSTLAQPATSLGASEYLSVFHKLEAGSIQVDVNAEVNLIELIIAAADQSLLESAHDCSVGGLAITLAEGAVAGKIGIDCSSVDLGDRIDAACFGEAGARVVVSVIPSLVSVLTDLASDMGVNAVCLGTVGGDRIRLGTAIDISLQDAIAAYQGAFQRAVMA